MGRMPDKRSVKSYTEGLNFKAADSVGYVPDMKLIGNRYTHQNGHCYIIGGFSWNADSDRWMVGYKRPDSPLVYMRSPENFFGLRDDRPRFVIIHPH